METLLHIVQTINFYLSDYILVVLLVGTGVFFSLRTRFVQVRCFGEGMRRVFGGFSMRGGRQKGGLSSFQALTTAIAAQVGTGNIIGSCSAILVGGPGAIFWMWIIAFFGMSTIYAEAVLAQETRVVHADGTVTQKVLTAQLRQMEASGLLTRTVYAEVPPRVEYTLTDLGRSLRPVLDAMEAWGKAYQENAR